jgi:hypothetical protein
MMDMTPITEFLAGPRTNEWLVVGKLRVYVRKGYHAIGPQCYQTFDVASAELPQRQRGKGTFTAFLEALRPIVAEAGIPVIYAESILETRLVPFFERIGYTPVPRSCPPCFYLLTT